MWAIMYISYFLMFMSVVLLGLTGLMGYFHFLLGDANHIQWSLISSLIYMFTETLIMFYFIATGKQVKEMIVINGCDKALYKPVIKMKMKLFPHVTMNMIVIGAVFIIGGAVDKASMPAWIHGTLFLVGYVHFLWLVNIQHRCFKENTELVIHLYDQINPQQ